MNTKFFIFTFVLAILIPSIDGQTFTVSPNDLSGWSLTGAKANTTGSSAKLTLPADAQLSRTFTTGNLTVVVVSRPVLGREPTDWPVLELDSAAVVFSRHGDSGTLAVVVGNNAPVELPISILLDASGRCVEPLTVSLGRQDNLITVAAADQTWVFPIDAVSESAEIILSAGANASWELDSLSVNAIPAPAPATSSVANDKPANDSASAAIAAKRGKAAELLSGTVATSAPVATPSLATATAETTPEEPVLEIFTPPSVRIGRAAVIRQVVANSEKP